MMSAAASFLSSTMLRLYESREEAGDYSLTCHGVTVKAHSFILANSTDYFERAMATAVGEGGRLGMDVGECEPATLDTVVAFMYGVEVPEGFPDLQGLLGLADRFLLEEVKVKEVKDEAGRRIALHINAQNFMTICKLADLHKAKALAVACAKFMLTKEEEMDCGWLHYSPLVVIAVAEETNLAIKRFNQEKMKFKAYRSRGQDFDVDEQEYGEFIKANVAVGTRVGHMMGSMKLDRNGTIVEIHDNFSVVSWYATTPRGGQIKEDVFYHALYLI